MKPLEFLAEVLPSPGHGKYCAAELTSSYKKHVFVDDLAELTPTIKQWLKEGKDIYFALSVFDDAKKRKADNAVAIKSLFIDMDGYASKKEAVTTLAKFLEKTGLDDFGTPHVVSSGGGVHCYWPLTEESDIVTWKPIAENFKRLCRQEGMRIDESVTGDAARVLRIPGTFNHKAKYKTNPDDPPLAVRILIEGNAKVDLKRFGATVRSLLDDGADAFSNTLPTSVNIEGVRPSKAATQRSAAAESLISNSVTRFNTIWIKTEREMGCKQLGFYMENAEQDGMEPLWRGLLSWTKVCDDGHEYSTKLTEMHPYEPERMRQKLEEIKGPYACVKMDEVNGGICPSCPHWGKITNPLALGRDLIKDNKPKLLEIPAVFDTNQSGADHPVDEDDLDEADSPAPKTRQFWRPLPPKGFSYGPNGGVFRTIEEKDSAGNKLKVDVPVLSYDLYALDILRLEEKDHHVQLLAIKPIGELPEGEEDTRHVEYTTVILPMKATVSKDELLKCLASNNILASFGRAGDDHLFNYVRAIADSASNMSKPVDVPIQFGWQKDRSFVYNNRVFRPDGTEVPVPMPGMENINRVTNSKGTIEGWRKFWNLMIRRKMDTMLALCTDAFGSTLMHFSEYEGFVWHIGSTESGTGKSLTLTAKAAVWGHPIRYRTGKSTSSVAMQQRAGLLNSMPLLIDEITAKARNDMEWAPNFIFDIAEGQGKERMESGSNKERVNNSTWALTCTMTSNTHMFDILTGGRKHSSNGEIMRMLEWTPTSRLQFSEEDHATLSQLRHHYGVAGEMWVRWLVQNYDTARRVWAKTHARLREVIGFTDEERYWHAACTATVTAAILMGQKYADIIDLPVQSIVSALEMLVRKARDNYRASARSAEDVLNTFTREFYGKFVVIRKDDFGKLAAELGADMTGKTSTRNTVMGRIEQGVRDGYVDYFIEEQLLKEHCASMSFGYSDFKRQLGDVFVVKSVKKDLLAKTDGPSLRVSALHIAVPKGSIDVVDTVSVVKS
jgi:hypothetical protein